MDKKMTLCSRGHYYDKTTHSSCPVCRNTKSVPETRPASQPAESGLHRAISPQPENATKPVMGREEEQPPVVGWIVTLTGPKRGRDYRIFTGYNTVGRSLGNRIQILGDETISREKQAAITFDHINSKFYIQHGGGQNLTYLNKSPLLSPTELTQGDVITMGKSEFVFIPLCTNTFTWEKEDTL